MCKLAGRTGRVTGVMISNITDPEYVKYLKKNIEAGARSVSRNPDEIEVGVVPGTIISNNRDEAFKLAMRASAVYLPYLHSMTEFVGVPSEEIEGVTKPLAKGELQNAVSLVSDKSVDSFKMWGTPNDIIEKVSKLIEEGGGVDRINFRFGRGTEDSNGIKILGEKVLRYFCTKS